jgi:hypothetical protein
MPHLTQSIHDYFLAKSLDVVRPGGVLALITSRYTMDKQDSTVRRHLADNAVLLGAVRLPNTAFKANAGTEVTTDILFLQKRSPEMLRGESWTDLQPVATAEGPVQVNEYFARHPEMMLGRMGLESGQFGATPALIGNFDPAALEHAIEQLPAGVYTKRERHGPFVRGGAEQVPAVGAVKDGGFAERDGQILVRHGDVFKPLALSATLRARIRGMLPVRDAVREVFRTQLPELEAMLEFQPRKFWFAVPGMSGGFSYWLAYDGQNAKLITESWCRVCGGSGQRHEITAAGSTLVDEGFV